MEPVLPTLRPISTIPRPPVAATPHRASRLGWLDALRGIAALVVAFAHSSSSFQPELQRELMPTFNIGRFGIMVFFLVSGYIIPASLERRGDVRAFWIGRAFRIYPLCAVAVGAVVVAGLAGLTEIRGGQDNAALAVAHLTLFQELLGTHNLLLVLWTLSYEMAFYLLVVALFTVRQHQRSGAVAITLAVLAAVSVAAAFTMAVAIGCACSGSSALRVFGGVLGGVLGLTLVLLNGTVPVWEGLVILAVMFLGTAVHRAESGRSTWRYAAARPPWWSSAPWAAPTCTVTTRTSPAAAGSWRSCWPCSPSGSVWRPATDGFRAGSPGWGRSATRSTSCTRCCWPCTTAPSAGRGRTTWCWSWLSTPCCCRCAW